MKQNYLVPSVPSANIAVNKSRIKLYNKEGEIPTYYLQKGQEFQIELFNPTSDVVLAKIDLNGKPISQGGLVVNPGQRIFLDRYIDIAKKFLFDTYEVSSSDEVKKAIEHNGDIKIEFYKERVYIPRPTYRPHIFWDTNGLKKFSSTNDIVYGDNTSLLRTNIVGSYYNSTDELNMSNTYTSTSNYVDSNISTTLDFLSQETTSPIKKQKLETGRVEAGSDSDQKFEYVSKTFEYSPFHTVEYKLLPVSQKINTTADLNVKLYCTQCGAKLGKTDKFCSQCGHKA